VGDDSQAPGILDHFYCPWQIEAGLLYKERSALGQIPVKGLLFVLDDPFLHQKIGYMGTAYHALPYLLPEFPVVQLQPCGLEQLEHLFIAVLPGLGQLPGRLAQGVPDFPQVKPEQVELPGSETYLDLHPGNESDAGRNCGSGSLLESIQAVVIGKGYGCKAFHGGFADQFSRAEGPVGGCGMGMQIYHRITTGLLWFQAAVLPASLQVWPGWPVRQRFPAGTGPRR